MKAPRLSKSGIEYLDYAWNFYSGCENWATGVCDGGGQKFNCWARSITERFPDHYPNGFNPTFYPKAFLSPLHLKNPSIIGVAFMGDLFGDWINYTDKNGTVTPKNIVYPIVERCPQHTFLFLTKCPWNLLKWSPFPDNCWVGVTATTARMAREALGGLLKIEAKVKYISFEPLLERIYIDCAVGINWVIIGAQTKPYKPPKVEWVEEIVRACDKMRVPVFLKNNLFGKGGLYADEWEKPLGSGKLQQEFPNA